MSLWWLAVFCLVQDQILVTSGGEVHAASPQPEPVDPQMPAKAAQGDLTVEDAEDGEEREDGEAEAGTEAPAGSGSEKVKGSVQELQEKMALLKGLLEKRGDLDPALSERLEGLSKQLSSLGLADGLDLGSSSQKSAEQQVLSACLALSVKRAGPQRPATFRTLARLAKNTMTKEDAQDLVLMRLVAVCVNGLSDVDYRLYTAGKLDTLPKALAEKAVLPSAKAEVLALESEIPNVWEELGRLAGPLHDSFREAAGKAGGQPPVVYGLLATIPLLLVVAFLGKKFLDMKRSKREKEEEKRERSARKKQK